MNKRELVNLVIGSILMVSFFILFAMDGLQAGNSAQLYAIDLYADHYHAPPPSYSITIDHDHGGTLTYVDSQGLSTTIQILAGAVSKTTMLVYVPIESATPPANYAFAHHAFDLDAYRNGQLLTGFTFDQVVSVTIHYSHADVTGMDERTLKLFRWVPTVGWQFVGTQSNESQSLDMTSNVLTAWLRSLSRFGSMGASPGYDVFLPLVLKSE